MIDVGSAKSSSQDTGGVGRALSLISKLQGQGTSSVVALPIGDRDMAETAPLRVRA